MPNLRMIRRRITAVQNIQQVTRAMRMIAASRLRRAQEAIEQARPYAERLDLLMGHMASKVSQDDQPLLEQREQSRATIIVVVGDRGLCRGFNSNALRHAVQRGHELEQEGAEVEYVAVGKKAVDFFSRRGMKMLERYPGIFGNLDFQTAASMARLVTERFLRGETDRVEIVFNEFKSVLRQELTTKQYLPLAAVDPAEEHGAGADYLYEPDQEFIWKTLLDKYLNFEIWRVLLESDAAEQAARMTAMEEATNNAEDMIKNLISVRNKVRQTGITTELTEIVGSAEALAG